MIDEQELQKALDELDAHVRTVKAYMQELENKLNELTIAAATPTVKLPDEPGYYLTRQNRLLLKDEEGDWSARGLDGAPVDYFWEDEQAFTRDSAVIVSTLGVDTFPLIPVDVKRLSKAGD